MKKYKFLLFDLDDTLINNEASVKHAFKVVLSRLNIEYNDHLFYDWSKFEAGYWNEWEQGRLMIPTNIKTIDEKVTYLRSKLFIDFFINSNLTIDQAITISRIYNYQKGKVVLPIDGAEETLSYLSSKYKIAIVTNGPHEAAVQKIKKAGIETYVSNLISSEQVGFSKPMKEFFDYADEIINEFDRGNQLIIGDSLYTDILGGNLNGIDTCLYRPNDVEIPERIKPTMKIKRLKQLKNIL